MAKDKISDYSTTANSNTDIGGINVDEGCAPSGINDAIRTLMAQLKTWQSGGQDIYIHPAGSASSPSITANGDTNTGVFFPAADTVGITTGGTERARVDSTGNIGLGVTPSAWDSTYKALQVGARSMFYGIGSEANMANNAYYNAGYKYAASSAAGLYTIDANVHKWYNAASGTAGNSITFTEAMRLDASGNLLVNATSLSGNWTKSLVLNASTGATSDAGFDLYGYRTGDGDVGGFSFYNAASSNVKLASILGERQGANNSGALTFHTTSAGTGAERARIDSSGKFLLGVTSYGANGGVSMQPSATSPQVYCGGSSTSNSDTSYLIYSSGASAYRFYVGYGGTVYATSTTITGISDQRLKENIRDLDDGLDVVMALRPRKFDWKEGKGADIKNARGFIAQEFEEVLPDMVEEWLDPAPEGEEPYKAVNANLIPTLVKAIQELKTEFDAYKASHP